MQYLHTVTLIFFSLTNPPLLPAAVSFSCSWCYQSTPSMGSSVSCSCVPRSGWPWASTSPCSSTTRGGNYPIHRFGCMCVCVGALVLLYFGGSKRELIIVAGSVKMLALKLLKSPFKTHEWCIYETMSSAGMDGLGTDRVVVGLTHHCYWFVHGICWEN